MDSKTLWPIVAIVGVICGMVTALITLGHMDVAGVIAIAGMLFGGLSTIIGAVLYSKVSKVEQNVNGNASADKAIIKDYIEHLKASATTPVPDTSTATEGS